MTRMEHADAVSAAGRQRFVDGSDVDDVLDLFAVNGLCIIAAVRAARLVFGLSLKDARDLVETSQAYHSDDPVVVDVHRTVLQRLKPALECAKAVKR
ncbi:hypothetical protein [Actinoplanes sp. OR16]|uniref:hypothetical protein n=1 Tax=Actinoplanes sp. OR16 TaxID=946334 RepID=UPI000FD6B999|nr:hypothetical protein [Actinoplanes sp. OR16]